MKGRLSILMHTVDIYTLKEVAQLTGTTPNEADVTSSNSPPPSCVDMSKKKKKGLWPVIWSSLTTYCYYCYSYDHVLHET